MEKAKEEKKMVPITIHAEVPDFVAKAYEDLMAIVPESKQPDLRGMIVAEGVKGVSKQISKIALISILGDLL